jgi:seryl-tRNA synthetase
MLNNPENEFDDEVDLQIAYNDLFVECDKLNKRNKRNLKCLKETEAEKERLMKSMDECLAIQNTLISKNHMLIAKVKSLEKDLNDSNKHLKKILGDKLNQMLGNHKYSYERIGLGFNKFAASSSSHVASTSKIMFVKPKMEDVVNEKSCLPKETSKDVTKKNKLKFKVPVRIYLNSKFIPTYNHCGVFFL